MRLLCGATCPNRKVLHSRQRNLRSIMLTVSSYRSVSGETKMSSQPNPVSEFNHSPWVSQAKEHWKNYRPKMYAELPEEGIAPREGGEGSGTDAERVWKTRS